MKGLRSALLIAAVALSAAADAGQRCVPLTNVEVLSKAFTLAQLARTELDKTDARVVLLARIGQDLSDYGLTWSHAGFAVRDHPRGRWSVVHELNLCGTATSAVHVQGLANFYGDDLFAYRSVAYRLPAELETRLLPVLTTEAALMTHGAEYRLTAYPFSSKYQNSNGWIIETLAVAMAPEGAVVSRDTAQSWLRSAGYRPTTLDIGWLKRLGGRVLKDIVSFDDHPPAQRWRGQIEVATVDSIFGFLQARLDPARSGPDPLLHFGLPDAEATAAP
ncbi:DUF2145 domain-containing protein [Azoarcus olearius]|uniref:Conserved hypothetical secreted protein n=1 Tax=Azoarcus sp. (strain BH72) TaxID=418699 RepID=A1KBF8_AZOSB|nr:DUF2145 domain-containing protein [Azoarcus olearius]ANQ86708.1 hypothetical protein dqs_3691 [Azoarcus olearius]CAL96164.1 conserved hypothetical secreted protein [Azoarcus olearius]